jgi:hypothetical protein
VLLAPKRVLVTSQHAFETKDRASKPVRGAASRHHEPQSALDTRWRRPIGRFQPLNPLRPRRRPLGSDPHASLSPNRVSHASPAPKSSSSAAEIAVHQEIRSPIHFFGPEIAQNGEERIEEPNGEWFVGSHPSNNGSKSRTSCHNPSPQPSCRPQPRPARSAITTQPLSQSILRARA